MYIVHINPNHPKTCHDAGRCTSMRERANCISPKQMLLFEDGSYAYLHAGQDVEKDSVVYQFQPATSDTQHLVSRCHRNVVKVDAIDAFGISTVIREAEKTEDGKALYVLDFEGEDGGLSKEVEGARKDAPSTRARAGTLGEDG